jgi:glucan 1,3-beta-glucosidase
MRFVYGSALALALTSHALCMPLLGGASNAFGGLGSALSGSGSSSSNGIGNIASSAGGSVGQIGGGAGGQALGQATGTIGFGSSGPSVGSLNIPPANLTTNASGQKVRGVNLGGWFIVEPWMSPSLISNATKATNSSSDAADEWTLVKQFNNTEAATAFLQTHWGSWIVENDFAQMKSIGLNTVRLPIPHWAFSASPSEPYINFAQQPYISQALLWASKYGLDVILDMHTAPGSQNGYENSGHLGSINFGKDTSNADRLNSALQSMIDLYVNDAQYNGVVKYVEILNEPVCSTLGNSYMSSFYAKAAQVVNSAVSSSAVYKPQIILHDCFITPISAFSSTLASNTSALANTSFILDTHRYHAFAPRLYKTQGQHYGHVHDDGDEMVRATNALQRPVLAGEFSLAISCLDCATGITANTQQIAKTNRQFFETQTKAYERSLGWVFWSWTAESNTPWSFKASYAMNWIPQNIGEKSLAQ